MKHHRTLLALAACAALAACGIQPIDPSKMSAEQIRAMASDNKGMAYCVVAQNATGNVTGTFANLDLLPKIAGSSVTIEPNCKLTLSGGAGPTPPASAPR